MQQALASHQPPAPGLYATGPENSRHRKRSGPLITRYGEPPVGHYQPPPPANPPPPVPPEAHIYPVPPTQEYHHGYGPSQYSGHSYSPPQYGTPPAYGNSSYFPSGGTSGPPPGTSSYPFPPQSGPSPPSSGYQGHPLPPPPPGITPPPLSSHLSRTPQLNSHRSHGPPLYLSASSGSPPPSLPPRPNAFPPPIPPSGPYGSHHYGPQSYPGYPNSPAPGYPGSSPPSYGIESRARRDQQGPWHQSSNSPNLKDNRGSGPNQVHSGKHGDHKRTGNSHKDERGSGVGLQPHRAEPRIANFSQPSLSRSFAPGAHYRQAANGDSHLPTKTGSHKKPQGLGRQNSHLPRNQILPLPLAHSLPPKPTTDVSKNPRPLSESLGTGKKRPRRDESSDISNVKRPRNSTGLPEKDNESNRSKSPSKYDIEKRLLQLGVTGQPKPVESACKFRSPLNRAGKEHAEQLDPTNKNETSEILPRLPPGLVPVSPRQQDSTSIPRSPDHTTDMKPKSTPLPPSPQPSPSNPYHSPTPSKPVMLSEFTDTIPRSESLDSVSELSDTSFLDPLEAELLGLPASNRENRRVEEEGERTENKDTYQNRTGNKKNDIRQKAKRKTGLDDAYRLVHDKSTLSCLATD